MAILFSDSVDPQIVVMGMSCSGKTTFAKQVISHHHLCFDALFPWHVIETFGLSISEALQEVSKNCIPPFILDGWHLGDKEGKYFPESTKVYLVYAPYEQIVDRYRVPVFDRSDYTSMFRRWYYEVDYDSLSTRFFRNDGDFVETSTKEFKDFLVRNR